jgi:DNA-binding response OmpR family regulator
VTTVLVAEDDPDIRRLIRELLERAGHTAIEAEDGRVALRRLFDARPDLVILDLALPALDGWSTLERIRDVTATPVLILTARTSEIEKVRSLRAGADDYVTKPFGRQELVARVQALLRRTQRAATETLERYADALLTIDVAQRAVTYAGRDVELTPLEFGLLLALVRHPRQVLSREQLLELVWRDPFSVSPEQVKLYVSYLRRKLDPDAPDAVPIETVRGFGYRYRPPAD